MKKAMSPVLCLCLAALLFMGMTVGAGAETPPAVQRPEDDPTVMLPMNQYELTGSVEVNGRQGVCCEGDSYWVSGSKTLAKYDKDWNLIKV